MSLWPALLTRTRCWLQRSDTSFHGPGFREADLSCPRSSYLDVWLGVASSAGALQREASRRAQPRGMRGLASVTAVGAGRGVGPLGRARGTQEGHAGRQDERTDARFGTSAPCPRRSDAAGSPGLALLPSLAVSPAAPTLAEKRRDPRLAGRHCLSVPACV